MKHETVGKLIAEFSQIKTEAALLEFAKKKVGDVLLSFNSFRMVGSCMLKHLVYFLTSNYGTNESLWPDNAAVQQYKQLHYLLEEEESFEDTLQLFKIAIPSFH